MPRGNDAAAALADLRGEFAGAGGSAEDLIASSRAAWSPTLRTAINNPRDTDDEGNLIPVDLDKVQSKVGKDAGVVLSAAKRGPYVIAVIETESGRTYKEAFAASEVGFDKQAKRPSLPDPEEETTPDRDEMLSRMRTTAEAQALAAKAEEAAEEARRKVLEQAEKSRGASDDKPAAKSSGSGS